MTTQSPMTHPPQRAPEHLWYLRSLEQKVLWLSSWIIHHANRVRPARDGLKVGGHQASCASMATIMTALYFDVLRPDDRVAVKPHASPVFHAIQYLFGRQTRERLMQFRALGGAQSYPSRTKDADDVDFSTGSVGLGVAMTAFAALVQDYLRLKGLGTSRPTGRMVALAGDAEFDEGNVFEALFETWKHDARNIWWVIDYNRQSLDSVMVDRFSERLEHLFEAIEWRVVVLKYGTLLNAAFAEPGGAALREWIDACPNSLYSAFAYQGGETWRDQLTRELGQVAGIPELLDRHDDASLHRLMTNLGGHDLETLLDGFHAIEDDRPTCFIAYTIKGHQLPFEGHKDNHAGLMTEAQMASLKHDMNIVDGEEWEPFAGLEPSESELREFLESVPFNKRLAVDERPDAPRIAIPSQFATPPGDSTSTQEAFGRVLADLSRQHSTLADRIVTTSPDVTVSTNLGSWVNKRGIFGSQQQRDVFKSQRIVSALKWDILPAGQHIELGIAENNLFILLAAMGLSDSLFGERLIPIGTVYDPFISRGLDALNYACYQDARFILAGTPSGITLAPEGGAHQSVYQPLIGLGQPGLTMFEPTYADELAEIMRWSFEHIQDPDGGAVYLRLSTRPLQQPSRVLSSGDRTAIIDGAYWLVEPGAGTEVVLVMCGPVVSEVVEAHKEMSEDLPGLGILVVTSVDRLYHAWSSRQRQAPDSPPSHVEMLLGALPRTAGLVTVVDGHPATLSWLGSVRQHRVFSLGVDRFGQSGDIDDLYRTYGLDTDAIINATARLLVTSLRK